MTEPNTTINPIQIVRYCTICDTEVYANKVTDEGWGWCPWCGSVNIYLRDTFVVPSEPARDAQEDALEEAQGYPDDNPKTRFGLSKLPLHLIPPSAEAYLAMAFADGAEKYGPYNWREKHITASVYYAALKRHMLAWWDGEELASDSKIPHLAHAIACITLLIDSQELGIMNDDRPPPGTMSKLLREWTDRIDKKESE